jgi:antitoxin (DNA-binding transcriptional repressor) of toxin-antitoxin stability system
MTIEDTRVTEAVLEINVTDFKARCLALFKELEARRYDRLVVTRRGKPIAQLTPAVNEVPDPYGCMKGSVIIPSGVDLTEPVLEDFPEAESGEGPFFCRCRWFSSTPAPSSGWRRSSRWQRRRCP